MADRSYRWAFWGTGLVSHEVARDLALVPGAVLHSVGSRKLENAEHFARTHGAKKHVASLEELVSDREVDVVYVATPNRCHVPDALVCLAARKAVLLEKPFATSAAQARTLIEAAHRHDAFLMEAMWTRFIPAVQRARAIITNGELGRVLQLSADFGYPASRSQASLFAADGGGALLDRGVYALSLATFLLGKRAHVLAATTHVQAGVDEAANALLAFESGATAQLSASLISLGSNQALISGDRGRLILPAPFYKADRVERSGYDSSVAPASVPPRASTPPARSSLHHNLARVKRSLEPVRDLVTSVRSERHAFAGYGYQFQLAEVQSCIGAGARESDVMSLQSSLEVMTLLDAVRARAGESAK